MSLLLVDTDVTSFIFKGSDYAKPYEPLLEGHELALSFMTVAELFQWALFRNWGDQRLAGLTQRLSDYVTIPVDQPLCMKWAEVRAVCRETGRPISPQDAWIAATALRYELPLVTHNVRDFEKVSQLQIIAP